MDEQQTRTPDPEDEAIRRAVARTATVLTTRAAEGAVPLDLTRVVLQPLEEPISSWRG